MKFEKKIYNNAFWMMSEKIISIFGLFFVTSFVAKYVGPTTFGQISLAIALFQVVQIIAQMGGDNIIFKRVSKNQLSGIFLMKASTLLRGGGYTFIAFFIILYFYFFIDGDAWIYVLSVAVSYFFASIDVFSIYNNAILESRLNTISNVIGLCIGLGFRYFIALYEMNPYYLSVPIILTTLIPFIIRKYFFYVKGVGKRVVVNRKKIKTYSRYMLVTGVGIVASSISVAVYSRINQFTLGAIETVASVGVYSVAVTLGTSWGFISQALITSFFSRIYSEPDDSVAIKITARLNRLIFIVSIFFLIFIVSLGHGILIILYGDAYASAYYPMVLLCIGSLFSALGTVSYRYIVRLSGYYYLSKKMLCLLFFSIPLSYVLILFYGIIGAALSFVIVEFLSLTVMNYFFNNGIIWELHKITFFKWRKV
ncbi:oligosaccharide flippase family protein [Klebsiella pneumoniae]|uniref:Putative O-antigen transporter n=1 Tax=Klebsiella pneumoniae TaxID=573 RepID=A0A0G3F1J1_KLEPN|nr:oligosaccharide flippase family protein [Klebsiella pneumoniae]AKJ75369.1 wzx flippase [Klebsiella pneumoniae]EKW0009455.1 oligosaccharide flippase family protein [Klebsiella pneumoniae]ELA0824122.1 oligosaccharide flippase family protein [Klebsiella pneumoniae]MBQ5025543.1 hypothetical protein [Klebsiella pneumoniae]MCR4495050.1 oligosaccharide flippase family protein [Klebsiella pneumoniae]